MLHICNRSRNDINDNNYNKTLKSRERKKRRRRKEVRVAMMRGRREPTNLTNVLFVLSMWRGLIFVLCIFGDKNRKTNLCAFVKKIERQKCHCSKIGKRRISVRLSNVFSVCNPKDISFCCTYDSMSKNRIDNCVDIQTHTHTQHCFIICLVQDATRPTHSSSSNVH